MTLSSQLIITTLDEYRRYSQQLKSEFSHRETLQTQNELRLLREYPYPCDHSMIDELMAHLPTINSSRWKTLLATQYYNPALMKLTSCLLSAVTDLPHSALGADSLVPQETDRMKIRRFLNELNQIGEPSVNGYAFETSFLSNDEFSLGQTPFNEKSDDLFITKSPRHKRANNELIHELFIGLFGTNLLRMFIPNFAYVYGGFSCSEPFIDNKHVLTYCNNSEKAVNYIMYENVGLRLEPNTNRVGSDLGSGLGSGLGPNTGSKLIGEQRKTQSLSSYCKTCSLKEYLNVILQICYSLIIAEELIGFTHNDLHDGNVLIRFLPQPVTIRYPIRSDHHFYITTNAIATLIDYGQSHIVYAGHHYGVWYLLQGGIEPERTFVMRDLYKVFYFSLAHLLEAQNPTFEEAKILSQYFNQTETPELVIQNQGRHRFDLPPIIQAQQLSVDGFIDFMYHYFPEILDSLVTTQSNSNERLFECSSGHQEESNESLIPKQTLREGNGLTNNQSMEGGYCLGWPQLINQLLRPLDPQLYEDLILILASVPSEKQDEVLTQYQPQLKFIQTAERAESQDLIKKIEEGYQQFSDRNEEQNRNFTQAPIDFYHQQVVSAVKIYDWLQRLYSEIEYTFLIANYYHDQSIQDDGKQLQYYHQHLARTYGPLIEATINTIYEAVRQLPTLDQLVKTSEIVAELVQQLRVFYQIAS